MTTRVLGAVLLLAGSCGFAIALAAHNARQKILLRQLQRIVAEMELELKFRLTPLSDLCRKSVTAVGGDLKKLFVSLADRLDGGWEGDVSGCMNALASDPELPCVIRRCLRELGDCLGRFDLEGQLAGLDGVKARIRQELNVLNENGKERIRSYQTLAVCAGAALAILLI